MNFHELYSLYKLASGIYNICISDNFLHRLNKFQMSLPISISNSENNHAVWTKRLRTSLYRCIPILSWMPLYNADKLICDLIAGVTVGLTVIPQSLAYATLAGLEPQVCKTFLFSCMVFLFDLIIQRLKGQPILCPFCI
jgi:hypothetical protein